MHLFKNRSIFLIFCILASLLINFSSINYYFFQDDWFVLNLVKNLDLTNFLSIFNFHTDIIYYRPIGMQAFFLLANKLFGANALLFHFLNLFMFILGIYLVNSLVNELSKNKKTGFVAAFIYSTASFHFMTLSWLVLTWNFVALVSLLLSLKMMVKVRNLKDYQYQIFAFVPFLIGIFSSEFMLTYPAFALAVLLIKNKRLFIKRHAILLLPSLITISFYLVLRLFIFPIPAEGTYKPVIGFNVLREYVWYILWFLNVPEMLKYHLTITNLSITNDFLSATGGKIFVFLLTFILQIFSLIFLLYKSIGQMKRSEFITCLLLFGIALLPVVTLPNHSYPYYLTFAALPLVYFISNNFSTGRTANALLGVFIGSWFLTSLISNQIDRKTHWVTAEQSISKKVAQSLMHQIEQKNNQHFETVMIYPGDKFVNLAMMDQEEVKFLLNKNIKTQFFNSYADFANENDALKIEWKK